MPPVAHFLAHVRVLAMGALAVGVLATALAACGGEGATEATVPEAPPRAFPDTTPHQAGVRLSGGLVTRATGATCLECHEDVAHAYATSGMHESLTLPTGEGSIEARLVDTEITDPATGITGRFELGDGHYVQRLLYRDPDGVVRTEHAMRIDLVMGSGNAARSYLQATDGYLLQLPLTWYADLDGLALSPGPGFRHISTRHALHSCVTCHTGWTEPADRRELLGFRGEISLGIGCARCHGPAEEHCDTGDPRHVANPSRMDADRQAEVCDQCHFSGAVALVKRGASLAEYVPGEPLGAVYGVFEPLLGKNDHGTSIAGHGARMQLSRCFTESGAMTCTTCHNPHRGHGSAATAADTASGCLVCHQEDACHADAAARGGKTCAQCHMATVPSNDIAHTKTTDHYIQTRPPPHVARIGAHEAQSVGACAVRDVELVNVLDRDDELPGSRALKARAYLKGVDMARDVLGRPAPGYLVRAQAIVDQLLAERPDDPEALFLRGSLLYYQRRERLAARQLDEALARAPDWAEAARVRALVTASLGASEEAEAWLRRAAAMAPYDEVVASRLADVLEARGRPGDALAVLERLCVALGPASARSAHAAAIAWRAGLYERGVIHAYDQLIFRPRDPGTLSGTADMCRMAGLPERQCRVLYEEALRLAPDAPLPLVGLARLELREGRRDAALELLRRARRIAPAAREVLELDRELAAQRR